MAKKSIMIHISPEELQKLRSKFPNDFYPGLIFKNNGVWACVIAVEEVKALGTKITLVKFVYSDDVLGWIIRSKESLSHHTIGDLKNDFLDLGEKRHKQEIASFVIEVCKLYNINPQVFNSEDGKVYEHPLQK